MLKVALKIMSITNILSSTFTHTDSTDQVPSSNQVRLEHFEMKANDAYATSSVDVPTTENVAYMTADSSISPPQDTAYEQVFPQVDAVGIESEAYITAGNTTRAPQDVTSEQMLPGADAVGIQNEVYTAMDNIPTSQDVTYEQVLPEADESDINAYDYVIYNEP